MLYQTFYNGVRIPMLGFGVYQIPDYDEAKACVKAALSVGYRLIDTAQSYFNEKAVGEAIRESGIDRQEIFITTKLWIQDFTYEKALAAAERSMDLLGTDYLDLLLLHQPMGDYPSAWRALETLYERGTLRAIGMANCYPHVLVDLCETFRIKPMINQVEMHPLFQQPLNLKVMKDYQVVAQAWGPFNEGRSDFFHHPVLTRIAQAHQKSVAQMALRWNLDRGVVVIPKTVHEDRMRENFDVFDFQLTPEEHAQIAALDRGHSEIVNHFDPEWIKMLHGWTF